MGKHSLESWEQQLNELVCPSTQPKGEHIAVKFQWFVEWPMSLLRWLSIPPCYHVRKGDKEDGSVHAPLLLSKVQLLWMLVMSVCVVCVCCGVCVCVCVCLCLCLVDRVGTGQNGTDGLQ